MGCWKMWRETGSSLHLQHPVLEVQTRSNGPALRRDSSEPPLSDDLASASRGPEGTSEGETGKEHTKEPLNSANEEEYVIEGIVSFDEDSRLFRRLWTGYSLEKNKWQPAEHLPRNAVARFFKCEKPPIEIQAGDGSLCGRREHDLWRWTERAASESVLDWQSYSNEDMFIITKQVVCRVRSGQLNL